MKKVLSLFLSIVMIISAVSCVDLSAYANDIENSAHKTAVAFSGVSENISAWSKNAALSVKTSFKALTDSASVLFSKTADFFSLMSVESITLALTTHTSGDYKYTLLDDGTAEITGYTGSNTEIVIPDTVDDHTVTCIGDNAFRNCSNLTSIRIPDGIINIGDYAFYECSGIQEINLPNVETIGNFAFYGCVPFYVDCPIELIPDVNLGNNLKSIGLGAFANCGISSIIIPNSVTNIEGSAFSSCISLESVTIGTGVTSIGGYAFQNCTALTSITIPDSVKNIGESAFSDCSGLTSIKISNGITVINKSTFANCSGLTDITIPDGVTNIDDSAFENSSNLISVTIPNCIERIGVAAFRGCTSLSNVMMSDSVLDIEGHAFQNCINLKNIELSKKLKRIAGYVFFNCNSLTKIIIPDAVTSIEYNAFTNCSSLSDLIIPNDVTSIGSDAFYNCTGLNKVTIHSIETWCTIDFSSSYSNPLYYAHNLYLDDELVTDLVIPDGVEIINSYAFEHCTSLTSVIIPDSVTSMGSAFDGCNKLLTAGPIDGDYNIEFGWTEIIPANAFSGCTSLESVTIPDSVMSIGSAAFSYCTSLESVIIPDSVQNINEYVFYDCYKLKNVLIGNGLTSIGESTFQYCTSLENITIGTNVTTIGINSFYACRELKKVNIYSIEAWCKIKFYDNPLHLAHNLYLNDELVTDLVIPNGVTSLGVSGSDFSELNYCTSLKSIIIPDTVTSIGSYAFRDCSNLKSVTIPDSVTSIASNAFSGTSSKLILYIIPDSYAEEYAINNNLNYEYIFSSSTMKVTVKDESGNTLNSGYTVNWYESGEDAIVSTGNILNGADVEKKYEYEIILDEELGLQYYFVDGRTVANSSTETVTLKSIPAAKVNAVVVDENDNPVENADILIQQTNGTYKKETLLKSQADGTFCADLLCTNTKITVSANGYYDNTTIATIRADSADLGKISLSKLPETKITVSLNMLQSVKDGEEASTVSINSFSGVTFTVYNETSNEELKFKAQYPYIVIDSTCVCTGDTLTITASSDNGTMTAQKIVQLDENKSTNAYITFVQNGKISIDKIISDNQVSIMIFDSNGKFVKKYSTFGSFTSDALPSGKYSVLVIKSTPLFRSVSNIDTLEQYGLEKGKDYVLEKVTVSSGRITEIDSVTVPDFDEQKLYYTVADSTYYSAKTKTAIAGKLVTMTAKYKIDDKYNTSGQKLVFDIPDGMNIIEGSVIMNSKTANYSYENNRLTVNTNKPSATVKFYISADTAGDYDLNANLSFCLDGETITQPVGSAAIAIESLKVQVAKQTSAETTTINGTTLPKSKITVYVNDKAIGETTSNSNGSWWYEISLEKHYLLTDYSVYVVVETRYGTTIESEEQIIWYNSEHAECSKITMINTAHPNDSLNLVEFVTEFNFKKPSTKSESYNYWPNYPSFTFKIEFDKMVENVILYVYTSGGDTKTFDASYDEKQDIWLVTADFTDSHNLPVNVGVYYMPESYDLKVSRQELDDIQKEYDEEIAKNEESQKKLDEITDDLHDIVNEQVDKDNSDAMLEHMEKFDGKFDEFVTEYTGEETDDAELTDEEKQRIDAMTDDELNGYIEDLINEYNDSVVSLRLIAEDINAQDKEKSKINIKNCDGITENGLVDDGFETVQVDDGSKIYTKATENECYYVDYSKDLYLTLPVSMDTSETQTNSVYLLNEELLSTVDPLKTNNTTMFGLYAEPSPEQWDIKMKGFLDASYAAMDTLNQWATKINDLKSMLELLFDTENNKYISICERIEKCVKEKESLTKILNYLSNNKAISFDRIWQQLKTIERTIATLIEKSIIMKGIVKTLRLANKIFTPFVEKIFAWIALILDICEFVPPLYLLYRSTPPMCSCCKLDCTGCDCKEKYKDIKFQIYVLTSSVAALIASDLLMVAAAYVSARMLAANPESVPVSTPVLIFSVIASIVTSHYYSGVFNKKRMQIIHNRNAIICPCSNNPNPLPSPDDNPSPQKYNGPGANPNLDPSGYVCEAVPSNRVEGVTATAYYLDDELDDFGEPTGNKIPYLWDASDYDQINPIVTGISGEYAWDVPQGQWQVKYEKDGYETAYSDWMPVPPPQTEVNVALVSKQSPEVQSVNAYTTGVRIEFSQYMNIDSVNTDNISVMQNTKNISGTITPLNAEGSFENPNIEYASVFMFTFDNEISNDNVNINVKNVSNYCSNVIKNEYNTEKPVTILPKSIDTVENVTLAYNGKSTIDLNILPAESGKNKKVTVTSCAPSIVSVSQNVITADENGKASVDIYGNLPGMSEITFLIDGTDITAKVIVNVDNICNHKFETIVTKATTSKNGSVVTKCAMCGEIKSETTVYYPKTVTLSAASYTYNGSEKKPGVTVKDSAGKTISSKNYTVTYSNNKNVGTATAKITFKGNYSGTINKTFKINPKNTSISGVTVQYKGFTVKLNKYTTQTTGYQIQYSTSSKLTSAKTVSVGNTTTSKTVTGLAAKKKYYVRVRTYKTVGSTKYYSAWSGAKTVTTSSYPTTIMLSATSYTYDGKTKKPDVTVKNNGKKISSKYYTVSYSSGRKNVGKYTVTIKFKSPYSGTVQKTFMVKPKATTLSSVAAKSKGFTVKWKKQSTQVTGYEIQYATDSKFTKNKKMVNVSKNSITSKMISKLTASKKYYVRIRTYKTVKVNGKSEKIYSSWSKAKTVTTKK